MKKIWLILCALGGLAAGAHAQGLNLAPLDRLAQKTDEVVNVTLDGNLLKLAAGFLSEDDKDSADIKKIVAGLKGIYVRSFKFAKEGEYLASDVAGIQNQLKGADWSRIVDVRAAGKELTTVYVRTVGDRIGGVAIVAAGPKELTVVNIVGEVDLERLQRLGGQMGIPKLDLERKQQKNRSKDEKDDE